MGDYNAKIGNISGLIGNMLPNICCPKRGVMKTSVKMDVDCRPVEKLSLVDIDHEKLSGVDVDRRRSTFNVYITKNMYF